jgi:hypothetical protein
MKAHTHSHRSKTPKGVAISAQRSDLLVHELEDAMHQVEEQVRKVKKSLAIKPMSLVHPGTRH